VYPTNESQTKGIPGAPTVQKLDSGMAKDLSTVPPKNCGHQERCIFDFSFETRSWRLRYMRFTGGFVRALCGVRGSDDVHFGILCTVSSRPYVYFEPSHMAHLMPCTLSSFHFQMNEYKQTRARNRFIFMKVNIECALRPSVNSGVGSDQGIVCYLTRSNPSLIMVAEEAVPWPLCL
jgi:hypothetical protein